MQFSKIRLLGFKSFVDPTELLIADGLTGVVGPNGCGKSNLLEALRWVMGENRPTAMRGSGMDDVIFAGAASRPARNYAEVTLHLDNSEHTAPPAFNEHEKLEIVRRITREAGSAYRVNGKEMRARDVQMLFADASTGAHSPALVRQGQISELINAKPKARRRVLEEAAGISGLYQRRYEAELKLNSAETNLARVDDLIEQLDNQLKSLARQAKQAQRYREIGADLRKHECMLLYRRWREADQELQTAKSTLAEATRLAAVAQGEASSRTRERETAESKLPPLREEAAVAAAVLQRLLVERDGLNAQEENARDLIRRLEARLVQLQQDQERESALNRDAESMIEQLEREGKALEKAAEGQEVKQTGANEAAAAANARLAEIETALDRQTEDVARLSARHQAAQKRLEDSEANHQKLLREISDADAGLASLKQDLAAAIAERDRQQEQQQTAQSQADSAETALEAAEKAKAEAQEQEGVARAELAAEDGEEKAMLSELSALRRMMERGAEAQEPVLDSIKVEPGYEIALGAALSDDLEYPIQRNDEQSGWRDLPLGAQAALPAGAEPISRFVAAPGFLAARLSQIGIVKRGAGASLQAQLKPGQRLISAEGDLWRWDGFCLNGEDSTSSAGQHLQRMNRLSELESQYAHALSKLAEARARFESASEALSASQQGEQEKRLARRQCDEALNAAIREASRCEMEAERLAGRLELQETRLQSQNLEAEAAAEDCVASRRALEEIGDPEAGRAELETLRTEVDTARTEMSACRAAADEIRREGENRIKRQQEVTKSVSGWRHRLETAEKRIGELAEREAATSDELKAAKDAPQTIAESRDKLRDGIDKAEKRKQTADDAVAIAETELRTAENAERQAERTASEGRETRARADAVAEAAEERLASAVERIDEEMSLTPTALLEQIATDPDKMPASSSIEIEVNRLKRQREALGAVNLRAEEDAKEVGAEHEALSTEKNDLEEAIRKLRQGISSLNQEGRTRLLNAFEEVNTHFSKLFRHLFGGGEANLVLVESDDPLEAGLEIMCQPPGKKLSTLSLLSGGEQTLTALSLIFAVFLSNPSPICVLDEVDAPLDDANVTRFCDLLDEMTNMTQTRFLIITHHALTMSRMDRLFGVTMAEQGVSQLVSVDLRQAEQLIDA